MLNQLKVMSKAHQQPLKHVPMSQLRQDQLFCPITDTLMKEPVTAADNHVYQHKNILEWLKKSNFSPVTGKKFQHRVLNNNIEMKQQIRQYIQKYKIPSSPQAVEIDLDFIIKNKQQKLKIADQKLKNSQNKSAQSLMAEEKLAATEKLCDQKIQNLKQNFRLKQEKFQRQITLLKSENQYLLAQNEKFQQQITLLKSENQCLLRQKQLLNQKIKKMDQDTCNYLQANINALKTSSLFSQHFSVRTINIQKQMNQPQKQKLKNEKIINQNNLMQQQGNINNQIKIQEQQSVVSITNHNKKAFRKSLDNKIDEITQETFIIKNNDKQRNQIKNSQVQNHKLSNFNQVQQGQSKHFYKIEIEEQIAFKQKSSVNGGNSNPIQQSHNDKNQAVQIQNLEIFNYQKQQDDLEKMIKEVHQKKQSLQKYFADEKYKLLPNKIACNHYIGQRVQGKKQGLGKDYHITKKGWYTYQGSFKDDQMQGFGKNQHFDGDIYVGNYKKGLFHGFGIFQYKGNKGKYQGYWDKGVKSGYGRCFISKDKQIYQGFWKNDKRQGQGRMQFKNGTIYYGNFHLNLMHGQGILKHPDGKIQQQIWKKGELKNGVKKTKK